jgi:hypothetical protein
MGTAYRSCQLSNFRSAPDRDAAPQIWPEVLASLLAILQRRKTALGTEAAQQLHHVVIMFRRRITRARHD